MVPTEVGAFLHAAIADSRLVQLRATGHFPHVSGPDETASVLTDFLRTDRAAWARTPPSGSWPRFRWAAT